MEENLKQQPSEIIKIVMFGPESTGKTTLAKQLAHHFNTNWAPEFARDYLQQKWDETQEICEPKDLLPIAIGQTKLENTALLSANKFLFCDTCLLVTKVFSEIYYNFCDPALDKAARKHKYDLFFLTDIDVPWKKDDLRDHPEKRNTSFTVFKQALIDNKKPFIILSGDEETRLEKAIQITNDLAKAKSMGLSSIDFISIYNKGINLDTIQNHFNVILQGHSKSVLVKPAKINDGISKFSATEIASFADYFDDKKEGFKLEKFVPASGAATRMFKFLNEFLVEYKPDSETINAYINRKKANELTIFITALDKLAFFESVDAKLKEIHSDFISWDRDKKNFEFIKLILNSEQFNYSNKPKAVIPFHKYGTKLQTPLEEHLIEAVFYSSTNGKSNLHFTISQDHQSLFESILESAKSEIEKTYNTTIKINFSNQKTETETIALTPEGKPFRDLNEELLFRPAGHGALIKNLNSIDADIVFIKNIDNVSQNHIANITLYKKALAGILIQIQEQIFKILNQIENNTIQENDLESVVNFIQNKLNESIKEDFFKYTFENKINYIKNILNKPIRVCGMVKNEGEPGGGPFWVSDPKGNISLQIIESSQVDPKNQSQTKILADATHFNPVDLVCGIKDFKGNKFNLEEFVDPTSGFVVKKNHNGKALKSYELPGLWNGAMAKWTSVFVEVPLSTFNPVKTVNDLLKTAHQAQ